MNAVLERPERPSAVGRKFNRDGSVCRFPGNALLCHITSGNPGFAAIGSIQRALRDDVFAKRFTFLPPASLHMTLLEGVSEQLPATWPADAVGHSLAEVTAQFAERLRNIDAPSSFRMRPKDLVLDERSGSVIRLVPGDAPEQRKLANFRARLADLLRIPEPREEAFFHVDLSYLIDWPTAAEESAIERAHSALTAHISRALSVLELGRAELCSFENILYFERLQFVGSAAR
jgi:hypothetical protein